jgi:hypothetical protein
MSEEVNWNHDVAAATPEGPKHRIMRHSRFSLCGAVVRDQSLMYVGTWDTGAKCDCPTCNQVWAQMRRTAKREKLS